MKDSQILTVALLRFLAGFSGDRCGLPLLLWLDFGLRGFASPQYLCLPAHCLCQPTGWQSLSTPPERVELLTEEIRMASRRCIFADGHRPPQLRCAAKDGGRVRLPTRFCYPKACAIFCPGGLDKKEQIECENIIFHTIPPKS